MKFEFHRFTMDNEVFNMRKSISIVLTMVILVLSSSVNSLRAQANSSNDIISDSHVENIKFNEDTDRFNHMTDNMDKKLSFTPNPKFIEFLEETNREVTVKQTENGMRILVYNYSNDPTGHSIPSLQMTVPCGWKVTYSTEIVEPLPQTVTNCIVNEQNFIYYVVVEKTGEFIYTEDEVLNWYLSMDIDIEPTISKTTTEYLNTTVTTTIQTNFNEGSSTTTTATKANTTSQETTTEVSTEIATETTTWCADKEKYSSWAINDYESKNGIKPSQVETNENADGTLSIILTDENGKLLDTYTIDPITGIGTSSHGAEVNLPQTGVTTPISAVLAVGAVAMVAVGIAFVFISKRRHEDQAD